MSAEAGTAGAPTEGAGAPPMTPDAGVAGSTGAAGASVDPGSSFLGSQFDPAAAGAGEAPPPQQPSAGQQEQSAGHERPEYVKEQFWDPETGQIKAEDLAKSYTSLEHFLGKEKVPVPSDPEDEESIERWVAAVRPESPDAYQFERSEADLPQGMEYDSDLEASFRNLSHQVGLMPHQAKALHENFFKLQTERYEQYVKMREESLNHLKHELQRKHGQEYPTVERRTRTVMSKYADAPFVEFLNESGLGNDPRMIDMLDRMGRDLEGSSRLVGRPQAEGSAQDVQSAIATYREKHHKALFDREHPNHGSAVKGLNQLYEQLYGDAPAI